ncbi:S41 family peptidase [uncultured Pontibacter sp.]|uniref:S41 family peptidase n=1 Tax=uncultured Pontibacter sp. TaxID=453356 RepID=UPI002620EB58|nr:S41 family peptidase [uncultured Pontibacter sp.]
MKLFRTYLVYAFLQLVGNYAYSGDIPKQLDKKTVNRIATFTKVWGLMKYYHPGVATGTMDWDSLFVVTVPEVAKAKNQQEFHKLLDNLYGQVHAPKLATAYNLPQSDTVVSIFSVQEISNYNASIPLKRQLKELYERHLPIENRYTSNKYKEYTLDHVRFLENPMPDKAYPDWETRLLALARYWNAINFFYPHKLTIGKDWETTLAKYIPVFSNVENELAYHLAMQRLNKELRDSHTYVSSPVLDRIWGPNPYFKVSYVQNQFVITEMLSDSIAKSQDVQVGDVITAIDGKPVKERVRELEPLMVGSNEAATYRDIANYLLNVNTDNQVTIEIRRGKNSLVRQISRYPYQELVILSDKPTQTLWNELKKDILYVDFTSIKKTDTLQALFKAMQSAKAVVFDLRGYPNFQVYQQTLPALYGHNFHVSTSSEALVQFPGFFAVSKSVFEHTDTSTLIPYQGKMIVLVDERTQSLPESFAMGLAQRPNTLIMGSQTAGTTGNITWLPLPGGANAAFTAVGERGAGGTFVQRKGVRIGKVVRPTVASVVAGKDAVIYEALAEAEKAAAFSVNSDN